MRVLRALLVAMVLPTSIAAQEGRWQLAAGISTIRLNRENGWSVGPVLRIEQMPSGRVGFDAAVRVFFKSSGFYSAGGLAGDAGVALPLTPLPLQLAAIGGVGALLGGDSDGTIIAEGGPYAGLRLSGAFSRRLGWSLAGAGRVWIRSGTTIPGAQLDAGLAYRW